MGLYKDFGAYKNERPARVVMTDAGLNDYINDLSFFPGFGEGEGIIFPLILYLLRGLLLVRVWGFRRRFLRRV